MRLDFGYSYKVLWKHGQAIEKIVGEEREGESLCKVELVEVVDGRYVLLLLSCCCTPRFLETQADGTKTSPWPGTPNVRLHLNQS